jgi:hypothetical protein
MALPRGTSAIAFWILIAGPLAESMFNQDRVGQTARTYPGAVWDLKKQSSTKIDFQIRPKLVPKRRHQVDHATRLVFMIPIFVKSHSKLVYRSSEVHFSV